MTLPIAFAATSKRWQLDAVQWFHSFATDEHVAAVIADPRDLFAVEWRVLLIDGDSAWLRGDFADRVHANGRGLVAVVAPGDRARADRVFALGVDHVVVTNVSMPDLAAALHAVAAAYPLTVAPSRRRVTRPEARSGGQVIAVGGPPGAGAERIAVGLAVLLSGRKQRVVLVDGNDVDARIAARLDLHFEPNIATASARTDGDVTDDVRPAPRGGFDVLVGLADPAQWSEVNPRGVRRVLDALAATYDRVIVVVGPIVEPSARFAITTTILGRAEAVVPVGEAIPGELATLVTWVANAATAAPDALFYPVATHAHVRRSEQADLAAWLAKVTADVPGADVVTLVPAADAREARSRWDGRLSRRRDFLSALRPLAREVTA